MAETEITHFSSMLGALVSGAAKGQQQAQQENDAEEQRQQQLALQVAPLAQNLQTSYQESQRKPFESLSPHLASFTPGSKADILHGLSASPTGVAPGITGLQHIFPQDTPAGKILGGYGTPTPTTGTPGGAYPYGPPKPVGVPQPSPGAAAPLPGGVVEGGMVAPGGAPGAAAPTATPGQTTFAGPGGQPLTLGADPRQIQAARGDLARMAPRFGGKDLPPGFREDATAAIAQANQQIAAGDIEGARATLGRLQGMEADIPRQTVQGGASNVNGFIRQREARRSQFLAKPLSPDTAYGAIVDLAKSEKQIEDYKQAHPDQLIAGDSLLSEDTARIEEMQAARERENVLSAQKTRTPAEEAELAQSRQTWRADAQDIHDRLRYGIDPKQRGNIVSGLRQWLALQRPEDRTTDAAVAYLMNPQGGNAPQLAQLVRDRGLNFGGADAERQTTQLLQGIGKIMQPGTSPQVQAAYADQLRIMSTLAGHPVSLDPTQLARVVDKNKQRAADDAHDRALLEIARLKAQNAVEIKGTKWQGADLDLQIKQARLNQITGRAVDPALVRSGVIGKLREMQHTADQRWAEYNKFVAGRPIDQSNFDPEFYLRQSPDWQAQHPLEGDTAKAVDHYRNWKSAVDVASAYADKIASGKAGITRTSPPPAGTPKTAGAKSAPGVKSVNIPGLGVKRANPGTIFDQARARGATPAQIQALHKQLGY